MIRKPLLCLALLAPTIASGDVEKVLTAAHKASRDALAVVRYSYVGEGGTRTFGGQAVCIDDSGLFVTLDVGTSLGADRLDDFRLFRPGQAETPLPAKLLWLDEVTNIAFIQAEDATGWRAITFADEAKLHVGAPVASAGLMPGDVGHPIYLGAARVSTLVRAPHRLAYVTGGKLTRYGSPVFNVDGKAIGLVSHQRPRASRFVQVGRRRVPVTVRGRQETSYFVPVEEFADVLSRPRTPRRMSWIGALNFEGISADIAAVKEIDTPCVRLGRIVDGTPGDEAGLRDGDLIVGRDGKPLPRLGTPQLVAANLQQRLSALPPGTKVTLAVLRDGTKQTLPVTTEPVPNRPWEAPRHYVRRLGLGARGRVLFDAYVEQSLASDVPGVIVYAVASGSPAAQAGFRSNDVLTSLDGKDIRTVEQFRQVTDDVLKRPGQTVSAEVMRGESKQTLQIAVPSR
ncbi:MAG: PDZ domain-containing protein [Phycisphaerae bacterium]|nr:PDZ domain-containing protein [Phycisphaerae bacterium]